MDHTEALPGDVLASILRSLSPRDIAASRGVRKAWLAVVDAHRLVLPHLFPRSVSGICLNYVDYERSHLFARPSVRPAIYRHGNMFLDHCNGLLLCRGMGRALYVVNPATRGREGILSKDEIDATNPHLVFDPAASPHYEVFLIPKTVVVLNSPTPQRLYKSVNLRHDLMEWPPSSWTLNVFSSRTREWHTRSFVREGDAAGTMASVLWDPLRPVTICCGGPRWRYSTYWQGSLYVDCHGAFLARFSLSEFKYQVIKEPIDTEKTEYARFLGKSEKGVYLAMIHDSYRLQVWTLAESRRQMDWVLKHHIDLEPLAMVRFEHLQDFDKTWTIVDDEDVHHYYYDDDDDDDVENVEAEVNAEEQEDEEDDKVGDGVQKENSKTFTSEDCEWNSDDDNVMNIEDYDICSGSISFLGFHPYKEVIFLGLTSLVAVPYHLKSSKVQYLGRMRPRDYNKSPTNGIYEAFPYTPCMIGELLEHD
ncbi:hypothetical protein ACQ4PT_001093 [Festuca glaucescens]